MCYDLDWLKRVEFVPIDVRSNFEPSRPILGHRADAGLVRLPDRIGTEFDPVVCLGILPMCPRWRSFAVGLSNVSDAVREGEAGQNTNPRKHQVLHDNCLHRDTASLKSIRLTGYILCGLIQVAVNCQ